jgi:hypothetical protein
MTLSADRREGDAPGAEIGLEDSFPFRFRDEPQREAMPS